MELRFHVPNFVYILNYIMESWTPNIADVWAIHKRQNKEHAKIDRITEHLIWLSGQFDQKFEPIVWLSLSHFQMCNGNEDEA